MTKTKNKVILIISLIIIFALILSAIGIFVYRKGRLNRALENLDVTDKQSVIDVLSLAKDDAQIYIDIAKKQLDGENKRDGASLLWHVLQNIDSHNTTAKQLLKDYYGDSPMSVQVESATLIDTAIEYVTEHEGVKYGGEDGVYCSDFGGFVRYKISSACALSFCADSTGVYILDGADNCIKFISLDGKDIDIIKKDVREFVYFESFIYSIGIDGRISAPNEITLADGQFGANLRIVDSQVICDIYNSDYSLVRTATLG